MMAESSSKKRKIGEWAVFLVIILLYTGFILYNVKSTNRHIDSLLYPSLLHQKIESKGQTTDEISNEIKKAVREKMENDDFYAAISFNKSADRSEFFINVFGTISVLFLVLIGLLLWASRQDRTKSGEIIADMEVMREEAKKSSKNIEAMEIRAGKISEIAENTLTEMKRMRMDASRNLVDQIRIKNTAERFNKSNSVG